MTENQTSSNHIPEYQGGWWQDFLVALVFLTRLPLNPSFFFQMNALRSACRCFPLIGLIVGGAAGTIYIVSDIAGLPSLVSAILAVGAQILLTGALHEDAVGDVADGFGGGQDKAKKLEIMRDSRVGTYAVVTLIIVLGLKVVAISHLPHPFLVFGILVSAAATSRGMITGALYFLPPARDDGLGHGSGRPELMSLLWAIILSILISVLVLGPHLGSLALFFAILGATFMGIVAKRQIGGQTGDVLGAVQQVSEICFILAYVAFLA